jgi:hypothetical protein
MQDITERDIVYLIEQTISLVGPCKDDKSKPRDSPEYQLLLYILSAPVSNSRIMIELKGLSAQSLIDLFKWMSFWLTNELKGAAESTVHLEQVSFCLQPQEIKPHDVL